MLFCLFVYLFILFGNTLIPNNILYGVMVGNISFIFDRPIIRKALNIFTNWTTVLIMCLIFVTSKYWRHVADWSVENMLPNVTFYWMSLAHKIFKKKNIWFKFDWYCNTLFIQTLVILHNCWKFNFWTNFENKMKILTTRL